MTKLMSWFCIRVPIIMPTFWIWEKLYLQYLRVAKKRKWIRKMWWGIISNIWSRIECLWRKSNIMNSRSQASKSKDRSASGKTPSQETDNTIFLGSRWWATWIFWRSWTSFYSNEMFSGPAHIFLVFMSIPYSIIFIFLCESMVLSFWSL